MLERTRLFHLITLHILNTFVRRYMYKVHVFEYRDDIWANVSCLYQKPVWLYIYTIVHFFIYRIFGLSRVSRPTRASGHSELSTDALAVHHYRRGQTICKESKSFLTPPQQHTGGGHIVELHCLNRSVGRKNRFGKIRFFPSARTTPFVATVKYPNDSNMGRKERRAGGIVTRGRARGARGVGRTVVVERVFRDDRRNSSSEKFAHNGGAALNNEDETSCTAYTS